MSDRESVLRRQTLIISRYVQILGRQQSQLSAGLHELYRRNQIGERMCPTLENTEFGRPLTHRILEWLGVLKADKWDEFEDFEGFDECNNAPEQPSAENGFMYNFLHAPPMTPLNPMILNNSIEAATSGYKLGNFLPAYQALPATPRPHAFPCNGTRRRRPELTLQMPPPRVHFGTEDNVSTLQSGEGTVGPMGDDMFNDGSGGFLPGL